MTRRWLTLSIAILAVAAFGSSARAQFDNAPDAAAATEPDKPFTMDDFKTAFKARQYQTIVDEIARIQADPKLLSGYKVHDLIVYKAETELRLQQTLEASYNFALAAKSAPEAHAAAVDTALSILVKRSVNLIYTPKHQKQADPDEAAAAADPAQTYDVTDMDQRKNALTALFEDEQIDTKFKITAAQKGASLLPILALRVPLTTLDALEQAATDDDQYVAEVRKALCNRALDSIRNALGQMDTRIAAIKRNANTTVEQDSVMMGYFGRNNNNNVQRNYYRRGLSSDDVDNLDDIISDADRIEPATNELAAGMHQDPEMFAKVVAQAGKVAANASNVLNANYSGRVR